jgi:cobalt-zinc-cadmium resistance protein CzcA
MVIQLNQANRQGIDDLKNLYVATLMENKFHYKELYHNDYSEGPAKISRRIQYRRIVVGVNVRNRDLESVVTDVQHIVNTKVNYQRIMYNTGWDNLFNRQKRLMIAVLLAYS